MQPSWVIDSSVRVCKTIRPPSFSGLGRLPFTQVTRVQIPLGVLAKFNAQVP